MDTMLPASSTRARPMSDRGMNRRRNVVILIILGFITTFSIFTQQIWISIIQTIGVRSFDSLLHNLTSAVHMTSQSHKRFPYRICVNSLGGRLGNEMSQYAAIYGQGRIKGMRPIVLTTTDVYKQFYLTAETYNEKSICSNFKGVPEVRPCGFDNKSVNYVADRDIRLGGFRQSWIYFHPYEAEIKREFTFKEHTMLAAKAILHYGLTEHLKPNEVDNRHLTFIGIHVRRGDLVNRKTRNVAPKEYFDKARNAFRANYSDVLFVVCSDDIKWCERNLAANDTIFTTPVSPAVDMAVLSLMNHTIMSVGTFGFWAGFLANGTTIYYKHPAKPFMGKAYSENMTDYYYPNWIVME